MSNCRRFTHEDVGAPPLYAYRRDGLYAFLDTIFLEGYNRRYITHYARNESALKLTYADAHGYKVGQLLQVEGAEYTGFNNKFRVVEVPTTTELILFLDTADLESAPEAGSETTIETYVAPLGWEKVFESETQRSYRSRAEKSSKVVVTFKQPTYHATQLKTTNAVCYEVDFSKDIDPLTGSTIDSCFANAKASYNHSCFYLITSTNSEALASSMNYNNASSARAPWTIVGDERFVFFVQCSYTSYDNNENSYDRQFNPNSYWNSYRYWTPYVFGDIDCEDPNEYVTGSSFYFKMYFFRNNSTYHSSYLTTWYNKSFLRPSSWSNYDYFFDGYDPIGSYQTARLVTVGATASDGYGVSGSRNLYPAYPQRISGGVTYFDYLAYSGGPNGGVNSVGCFYKGVFPYVKYCETNLANVADYYGSRTITLPIKDSKMFFATTNHYTNWGSWDEAGHWCFELD